ncbi:MAG: hypothetical protein QM831_29450 [Kofleriaceae bacterium]
MKTIVGLAVLGLALWASGVFGGGWTATTIQNVPWQLAGDRDIGAGTSSRATVVCTVPSVVCDRIADQTARTNPPDAPITLTAFVRADGLSCGWPFRTSTTFQYDANVVAIGPTGKKIIGFHGELTAKATGLHACATLEDALPELVTGDFNRQLERALRSDVMWHCPGDAPGTMRDRCR